LKLDGLDMICSDSAGSQLGEKVHVCWLEKQTELFKASEALKTAASISRELFHVEHSERRAGCLFLEIASKNRPLKWR
jgi:hypothetical protein